MRLLAKYTKKVISLALISIATSFALVNGVNAIPLSQGDRLRISIPEGDLFSGVFEVNLDGKIQVPYLDPISVKGLSGAEKSEKRC